MNDIGTMRAWLRRSIAAALTVALTGFSSVTLGQASAVAEASAESSPPAEEEASSRSASRKKNGTGVQTEEVPLYSDSLGQTAAVAQGNGQKFVLPLSELVGDIKPVMLRGVSSELRFTLPVPVLWQPSQVLLDLKGNFSGALIDTSQLVLKVNEHVVQQFALKSEDNGFRQVLEIPTGVLRSGFNDVALEVAQYSTRVSCESVTSPELWTQLDLQQSRMMMVAHSKPVPERVDHLDALFDEAEWQRDPVVPVMTASEPTEGEMAAMGLIAQGVGDRYGDLPVSLRHGHFPPRPADLSKQLPADSKGTILVGTFAQLKPYLKEFDLPVQSSPLIAVRALPDDPKRFAVVVAAETEADLASVAAAFTMRKVPWPDQPWVAVNDMVLPEAEAKADVLPIPAPTAGIVPLKAMGFTTTTYAGNKEEKTSLRFWNNNWRGRLKVKVHLGYSSGMAPQSALNVFANGTLHGSIPLNNPDGGRYYNYAVSIPAGELKPGWNELDFRPVLVPISTGGNCPPSGENLAVTLYDDTIVEKSGGEELQQTDLAVLAGLGASHADGRMGKGIAVQLTGTDEPTVSAGMTMLAKLSQVAGGPLLHARFGVGEQSDAQHHLWIGPYAQLPEPVKQAMPAAVSQQVKVEVPLMEMAAVPAPTDGDMMSTLQEAVNFNGSGGPEYKMAEVELAGPVADNNVAFTQRQNNETFTVFTASTATLLLEGINTIVEPAQWHGLQGSLAFWSPGEAPLSVASTEDAPFAAYGLRGGLGMWLSHYPWIALAGLLLIVTVLVMLTRRTLRFYRHRKDATHHD